MGARPYWYFAAYEPDVEAVLQRLRHQEFIAGRYNPVIPIIDFPVDTVKLSPGARHASIEQAREAAGADGTRSILDIEHIGREPGFCVASPLDNITLVGLFDTPEPTHEMVESNLGVFSRVERGHAIFFTVYRGGVQNELFFAGYSFD